MVRARAADLIVVRATDLIVARAAVGSPGAVGARDRHSGPGLEGGRHGGTESVYGGKSIYRRAICREEMEWDPWEWDP